MLLYLLVFVSIVSNAQTPSVTSFTPSSGGCGAIITLTGTNLSSPTSVKVNGTTGIVLSSTSTSIQVLVMPGSTTGVIAVTNGSGTGNSATNFTVNATAYPISQVGSKFIGTGYTGSTPNFGRSIAISYDGYTAVVGGHIDNSQAGAVWIYTRSGNTWTQQGNKLTPSDATGTTSRFGNSVGISADGNTIIVGANQDNSNIGAAWIFTRSGSTWSQQGNKLVGTSNSGTSYQGTTVGISADGNTAFSAGSGDNSFAGAVWFFVRSGSTWSQQGNKFSGGSSSSMGNSGAISADGNTVVIGAYTGSGNDGRAYAFVRSGTTWSQQAVFGGGGFFGTSMALSADGNTAAFGGPDVNNYNGYTWVWKRTGTSWSQQAQLAPSASSINGSANTGRAMALGADGNTLIVGGPYDSAQIGAAWVFTRSGTTWTQRGRKLTGIGGSGSIISQAGALAISGDGTWVMSGGSGDNNNLGAVWIYNDQLSAIADLSSLTISAGTLSPTFASATTAYTTSGTASSITVTPTVSLSYETVQVRVNGGSYSSVTSGSASGSLTLSVGSNTIDILVTAQDGSTKTYTITATRYGPPTFSSISPLSGNPGTAVTITGTNFNTTAANNIVFFGATKAAVSAASATSLTVTVPSGATHSAITVLNTGTNLAGMSGAYFVPTFTAVKAGFIASDFSTPSSLSTGTNTNPVSIAIGDLTGDGKPEVVVSNQTTGNVSVFPNTSTSGTISFGTRVDFTTGSNAYHVNLGDIDGDGKLDMVVANYGASTVSIFRNTSSGSVSFAAKVDLTSIGNAVDAMIGDIDGDGRVDITAISNSGTSIKVFLNTTTAPGSIAFNSGTSFTTGSNPYGGSIGDMDGDGKLDVVVSNALGSVSIFRNTSSMGSVSFATRVDATAIGDVGTALGDVDGDGKLDIATAYTSLYMLRNTSTLGSASLATASSYTAGNGYVAALADLDGDGKIDALTSNIIAFRNNSTSGSISLATGVSIYTLNGPYGIAVGDLDGDGKPDLVGANNSGSTVSVIRNNPAISTDANLASMGISNGTLSPTFASATTSYTATVNVSSITVTPTVNQGNATVQVKVNSGSYGTVASGSASGALALNLGSNTITVLVTAQNGTTTKTYTITVTRLSADASLSSLTTSTGSLSPAFTGGNTNYYLNAANSSGSMTVTPTVNQANATMQVRVNGGTYNTVTSGSASGALSLNVGSNTINVKVTAQDGTTIQTYNIIVLRAATAPGNCLNFDGTNDNVDLGSSFNLASSSFTLESWFRLSNGNNNKNRIITIGDGTGNSYHATGISIRDDNGLIEYYFYGDDGSYSSTANDGKWHHVAFSFDNNTKIGKLYLDGTNVSTRTFGGSLLASTQARISNNTWGGGDYFKGSLDEVRIWNVARTQSEIQSNYKSIINTSTSGLLAYYNFDDGTAAGTNTSTATLYDLAANTYNGALSNFALSGSSSNWIESYAMVVPVATAATNVIGNSFTANWSAPITGTLNNYLLYVSTNPSFTSFVSGYSGLSVSGTSRSITGLSEGTTYYYNVRADKTSVTGQGASSNIVSASTCLSTSSSASITICNNQLPYLWNGLTFTGSGTQTAHFTNAAGCDSAASLTVTVNNSPVTPSLTISTASATICSADVTTFTAIGTNPGPAPVYQWKNNNVNVGSGTSISFPSNTLSNGDVISCTLTANNACQTTATANSNTIIMTVKPSPAIGTSTISPSVMCIIGGTRNVYNSNTNGGGVWSCSNTNVATVSTIGGANGSVTAQGNGTATLIYTKTGANGCVVAAGVNIIVDAVPAVNTITGVSSLCKNASAQLNSTTAGGVWSSQNVSASVSNTGSVTGTGIGTAVIQYTVTNGNGCTASTSKSITINAIPNVPNIGYAAGSINPQAGATGGGYCNNKNFTLEGTPAGGAWSSTGGMTIHPVSGAAATFSLGAASVTYTITSAGCSNSRTIAGNVMTCASRGVNTSVLATNDSRFTLYPNPAKSFVRLNVHQLIGGGTIVITDLYGKQIKQQPLSMGNNLIDVSKLAKGMYMVYIITSDGKRAEKLIIE